MSYNPDSNNLSHPDLSLSDEDIKAICSSLQLHLSEPEGEVQQMRLHAVNHPDTDPQVLHHIASCGGRQLASRVADHPRAMADTLNQLAMHDHHEVRAALADNQNIPIQLQWQLAEDEHPDVRFALAQGYHIDQSVLASLLDDENPFVVQRAKTTLQRKNAVMGRPARLSNKSRVENYSQRRRAKG